MSIDGIPQNSNSIHKIQKVDPAPAPKVSAPKTAKPAAAHHAPTVQNANANAKAQAGADAAAAAVGNESTAATPAVNQTATQAGAQSVMDLQAVTEKLKQANQAFQTRNQISELGRSIVETKDALQDATHARMEAIVESSEEKSFFANMDIMEKAQHINRLKDQIINMEMERGTLVSDLREKVLANEYDPSGEEILQGMMKEYF